MRRILLVLAATLLAIPALGEPAARYDFDEVHAEYALTFVAVPENATGDWAQDIAGGPGLPITVTYGDVVFVKGGQPAGQESFLKVEGVGGKREFLVNSLATGERSVRSLFWSAKVLVNTSVVKDFTPPILSAVLIRDLDGAGNTTILTLSTSDDGNAAQEQFFQERPSTHLWHGVVSTGREAGLPRLPSIPGVRP